MDDIIQSLLDVIKEKDDRIAELTNIMLKYFGMMQSDTKIVVPEAINNNPVASRWNRLKTRLEEKSRQERFTELANEASKELNDAS